MNALSFDQGAQVASIDQHFVYTCFDRDGDVIYVGCTGDVDRRLTQHASSPIGMKTKKVSIDAYPDRRAALEAERARIRRFEPIFNQQTWFMDVDAWPRLRILQRLWLNIAISERVPALEQNNATASHLRRMFIDRFGEDPLGLVAHVKTDILEQTWDGERIYIPAHRLIRMKAYPNLSPTKYV